MSIQKRAMQSIDLLEAQDIQSDIIHSEPTSSTPVEKQAIQTITESDAIRIGDRHPSVRFAAAEAQEQRPSVPDNILQRRPDDDGEKARATAVEKLDKQSSLPERSVALSQTPVWPERAEAKVDAQYNFLAAVMDNDNETTLSAPTIHTKQRVFRWSTTMVEPAWEWSTIGETGGYVTLSHTWGAEADLLETTIVGIKVRVSQWKRDNLVQWIQHKLPNTWIWMDILCIPQRGDKRIIAACLQSIPQIFEEAECVHVLLEDEAPRDFPTYEKFDEEYALTDEAYGSTPAEKRQLPVLKLIVEWAKQHRCSLPDPAWMQRFWTRQEAHYAKQISFHGVGPTKDYVHLISPADTKRLGPLVRLSSSMVELQYALMCKIIIELIAARSMPIVGLSGRARQRAGGLVMAFSELRAARRITKKSQDYVLALFPTFDWYRVPDSARTRSSYDLLSDALQQFESSNDYIVLRPTMDGIFSLERSQSRREQENMFQSPKNSFDFFSTLSTIGHCKRGTDGSAHLITTSSADLTEWPDLEIDEESWSRTLADICIPEPIMSQERYLAYEALEIELDLSPDESSALREFLLPRNAAPLASLPDRAAVIAWLTCIHLIFSHRELQRVIDGGARMMLVRVAGIAHLCPAIVAGSWTRDQALTVFVAPTLDAISADIAFLGYVEENTQCSLVGSLGSCTHDSTLTRLEPRYFATNAWDFWHLSRPNKPRHLGCAA
jgi:hypothetical protein